MRVSLTSVTTARAARDVFEAYGYPAKQFGCEVVTDCPTLLALPALEKRVGLAAVQHLDLGGGRPAGNGRTGLAQRDPAAGLGPGQLPADRLRPRDAVPPAQAPSRCGPA